jgi:uncharacterized membrane protein
MMAKAFLNWLQASWDALRTSLLLVPGVMFLVGIAMAAWMLGLEPSWGTGQGGLAGWIGTGSGEDARALMSTLLSAIITMASMAFSVTVVALSLAANTYGPRLIRTFRANLRTQLVLGTFVMTIVYQLLVLRTLEGASEPGQVPQAAVALGTLLALVSVLALLAFIQGVATSIVADEVVRRVRKELDSAVGKLPDLAPRQATASEHLLPEFDDRATRIPLPREGYVQSVQFAEILDWAVKHDAVVRLDFRPGDFVVDGDRKVLIHPCPEDLEGARREIGRFIVSGDDRTPTQDLEFAVRHLVEVAVRALSPGINDPFSAVAVIDRLRGGLSRLCAKQLPPPALLDCMGKVRLTRRVTTYAGALDAAFNQIRQAGSAKPAILIHMLDAIGAIAEHSETDEQRSALARHASLVRAAGLRDVAEPEDREDVERGFRRAMRSLDCSGSGSGDAALRRISTPARAWERP